MRLLCQSAKCLVCYATQGGKHIRRDHSRASNKAQVAAEKAGSAVNDLAQEQLKLQQVQAARSAMPPISGSCFSICSALFICLIAVP